MKSLKKRRPQLKHLNFTKNKWQSYLNGFEKTSNDFQELSKRFKDELILNLIRSHKLRISWKQELKKPLEDIFTGREYDENPRTDLQKASRCIEIKTLCCASYACR